MSFRELTMVDVREVIRRWSAGQSARQIAREGVVDRKTAGRYADAAVELGIKRGAELTDEVVSAVLRRVQLRPEVAPSEARAALAPHLERIRGWLEQDEPLTLVRIDELLRREGVCVSYNTLRRFARQQLGFGVRRPTVRVDDPPAGEEAQVDFGHVGHLVDEDGRRRKLWVLVVTLTASRYQFVWPTFLQTTEAYCAGLDAAWSFFGGMPTRIVIDNASSAVTTPHPQAPTVQRGFMEYAQERGLFVDTARVRRPQDKPRVENQMTYVRDRCFGGETFTDLDHARRHAETWCRDVAGSRVHGTTRRVPLEVFEEEERAALRPAPTGPFDVPLWKRAKVHPDHHVQVLRSLYSVPTAHIGHLVDVRVDSVMVRLYRAGTLIKTHGRVAPGKRATDPTDYPAGTADYATRSIDGVRNKLERKAPWIAEYARRLLAGPLPWIKMRQAYALLRLCDRFGVERVDELCHRSLDFDVVDVPRIERMVRTSTPPPPAPDRPSSVATTARFARDPQSFATRRAGGER